MRSHAALLVTLVTLVACSRDPAPRDPCVGLPAFATWLKNLEADGPATTLTFPGLVTLDGAVPETVPLLPTVFVDPTRVTFQGQLVGSTDDPDGTARATAGALTHTGSTDRRVMLAIHGDVPWSTVAPIVRTLAEAGFAQQVFLFVAGAPRATQPTIPSSIDAELDAIARAEAPSLGRRPAQPSIFASCPPVDAMWRAIDTDDRDKGAALVARMPDALAACGCKVELPAVQRWLWALYDRDSRGPQVAIAIDITEQTRVTIAPTTAWTHAAKALLATRPTATAP